jgi:hypothetical protein
MIFTIKRDDELMKITCVSALGLSDCIRVILGAFGLLGLYMVSVCAHYFCLYF